VVPYRNPLVTAKMLATIDVLSRGRVILGAGVGWLREEFEALARPRSEERGAVTDEYVKLMRAVWTTDPVTFEGKYCTVRDIHVLPSRRSGAGFPCGSAVTATRRPRAASIGGRLASDRDASAGDAAARRVTRPRSS